LKIVLTGGGTAGHVTPNIALFDALKEKGYKIHYVGGFDGVECGLVSQFGIPYYGISCGKLRRYFDLKNVTDIFRIIKGLFDSVSILKKIRPNIVFSKGGFVVVPVVYAAFLLKIPVIIHESDITPGLANRLVMPLAKRVCTSFPETLNYTRKKGILTGSPIRAALFKGSKQEGLRLCGFDTIAPKPVLMITGGSLGSVSINSVVFELLPKLLEKFHVIHLCGKGNIKEDARIGYAPWEYAQDEMPHLLAASDMVISRAGANTIFELLALDKPNLLIPLKRSVSRGDQILNAISFEKQRYSMVLQEEDMTPDILYDAIILLYERRRDFIQNMQNSAVNDGVNKIMDEILLWTKGR